MNPKIYNKKEIVSDGMRAVEKEVPKDQCKKCSKSYTTGDNGIQDVVTLHRVMGEYWVYHSECFSEMAGPESMPPQRPLTPTEEEK